MRPEYSSNATLISQRHFSRCPKREFYDGQIVAACLVKLAIGEGLEQALFLPGHRHNVLVLAQLDEPFLAEHAVLFCPDPNGQAVGG